MSGIFLVSAVVVAVAAVFALGVQRSYYSTEHPILEHIRQMFAKISPEYAKIPLREGNSAYTENKSVITLCLKDPETGRYYPSSVLFYVAAHELSHMITKSQGHGDEFKQNFAKILKKAEKLGLYDPRKPMPANYCGVSNTDHHDD